MVRKYIASGETCQKLCLATQISLKNLINSNPLKYMEGLADCTGMLWPGQVPTRLNRGTRLVVACLTLVDHPTQLICIWIFILFLLCQHTKKKDIAG